MELIPGLPNDLSIECLIRLPIDRFPHAFTVSKSWNFHIHHPQFLRRRKISGLSRSILVLAQARVDPLRDCMPGKFSATAPPVYRLTLCDPESGSWSKLPPVPGFTDGLPMFCQMVGVGAELVLMGGCDPVNWEVTNSVFVYSFLTGAWRRGTNMPGDRRLLFGCASDSHRTMYIAGGHDVDKTALRSVISYDVAEDKWVPLPDMANPRDECKAVFHGGKFHVIGGYPTEKQGCFCRDSQCFNVKSWQWEPVQVNFLESPTYARTIVDSCIEKLYMCQKGNVIVKYKNDIWNTATALPKDVCEVCYVTGWRDKLLVIGSEKLGDAYGAYVLDLKNNSWKRLETPGEKFTGHVQGGFVWRSKPPPENSVKIVICWS